MRCNLSKISLKQEIDRYLKSGINRYNIILDFSKVKNINSTEVFEISRYIFNDWFHFDDIATGGGIARNEKGFSIEDYPYIGYGDGGGRQVLCGIRQIYIYNIYIYRDKQVIDCSKFIENSFRKKLIKHFDGQLLTKKNLNIV